MHSGLAKHLFVRRQMCRLGRWDLRCRLLINLRSAAGSLLSSRRSNPKAAHSRPGPRARSRTRSVTRFRCMIGMPSVGSVALIKAPTPNVSLETASLNELAWAR
jgi:hypothetical protein